MQNADTCMLARWCWYISSYNVHINVSLFCYELDVNLLIQQLTSALKVHGYFAYETKQSKIQ